MMVSSIPQPRPPSDQFLEVLQVIEALNVEAERLALALAGARRFMAAEVLKGRSGNADRS